MSAEAPIELTLNVNGQPRKLHTLPMQTLAQALRDELGLVGTKIGCDAGDCGACTVLLDGQQVCACLVPAIQTANRHVETVEGAGPRGLTDQLRQAFLAHGAAQCGICTPGMLMAATSLLAMTSAPTRSEIEDALGGVLCRCTGYTKIVEAVMATPNPGAEQRHDDTQRRLVGQRLVRVDGGTKVAGTELFGADAAPMDALWMRVIRSPHAHASFTIGDIDALRAQHPGLVALITAVDVPGENTFGIFPDTKDQPVFAEKHVRFRGEAVAALVGTRAAIASISDADVCITWTPLPALTGTEAAVARGAEPLHAAKPDNVLTHGRLVRGDVTAARTRAVATATGSFRTGFVEHAYIEPEAGFAVPDGDGPGTMVVHASTQAPYMDRDEVARVLGIAPGKVRIVPTACGGGFGSRIE